MKNLATAIFLWLATFTAYGAEKINSPLQDSVNRDFKRVVVTGNTIVYFVQARREQVTIDDGALSDVSITQTGNKLRISSNQFRPVIVTVYFKNIYRIDASEQATVRSAGKINLENLQIILSDNAKGHIKAITNSLYTVVDGQSKLELMGTTKHHISITDGNPNLNLKSFIAQTTELRANPELAARWESDDIR